MKTSKYLSGKRALSWQWNCILALHSHTEIYRIFNKALYKFTRASYIEKIKEKHFTSKVYCERKFHIYEKENLVKKYCVLHFVDFTIPSVWKTVNANWTRGKKQRAGKVLAKNIRKFVSVFCHVKRTYTNKCGRISFHEKWNYIEVIPWCCFAIKLSNANA